MKVKVISELEATLYTRRNLIVYKGEYEMTLGAQDLENYKKEIEENRYATTEQKEVEKNIRELILKSIEEQINVYLKSQNRLL